MAHYRVLELSFIGNALREPGEIVEYDGEAAGNLELIEDEKPKKAPKPKPEKADADEGGNPEELA